MNKIKFADILIIFLAAVVTVYSFVTVYIKKNNNINILIRGQDSEWTFPINAEEVITVSGILGDTIVKLHDNRAWVESSPCDNQTCVASGFIRKQGQWAACLPNNVLIMIQGEKENDIDSAAW